jgi:excisionase family DNA binding protein
MGTEVKFPIKKQKNTKPQRIEIPVRVPQKRLYSIAEAAIYLGRSVWSVRELIWGGKLPCVKVGRRIHLDIIDLDQWIEKNKVKTFL